MADQFKFFYFFAPNAHCALVGAQSQKMQLPYSITIGNVELMHECLSKHSRMETARTKQHKETEEEGKKREVSMERSKAGTKERKKKEVPTA